MTSSTLDTTGSCHCGAVRFRISGEVMFNFLCHCKNCSESKGSSPVHLLGVIGADSLTLDEESGPTTVRESGAMRFVSCSSCHGPVTQYRDSNEFRVVFPVTLDLGRGEASDDHGADRLPDALAPQAHINYENRLFDWSDSLPKFKDYPGRTLLDDAGHAR